MNMLKGDSTVRRLMQRHGILLVLVALFIISSFINQNFLSVRNLTNISRQISITTILAFGQTILIIAGMLDLSCGSVLALSGLLSVSVYKQTGLLSVAFLVAIAVAVFCNILNGLMVTKFKTPPFIATLAMLTMAGSSAPLHQRPKHLPNWQLHLLWPGFDLGHTHTDYFLHPHRCSHLVYPEPYPFRAVTVRHRRK